MNIFYYRPYQFDLMRDLSQLVNKSPRNIRRIIEHNACSRAFFNPQRINDVLSRTKTTITSKGICVSVDVSLPMRKRAKHLIDITFSASRQMNSKLLVPLVGQQMYEEFTAYSGKKR